MRNYIKLLCTMSALFLLLIGCSAETTETTEPTENTEIIETTEEPPVVEEPVIVEPAEPEVTLTMGQKNALDSADSYLSFTAFSHSGLIAQLEFEGYTTEEATFAADNCGADWNEQAVESAKNYLNFSSFSRQGLIDQLVFEGFTQDQAEYGVTQNGY